MKTIEIQNEAPEVFLKKVNRSLMKGDLGKVMKVNLTGNSLEIRIDSFGTSKITFDVTAKGDGFLATRTKEQYAPLHGAFRGMVEGDLRRILERFGAMVTDG